jgi:hypothetical protein
LGALQLTKYNAKELSKIAIAGNLRNRLREPTGEQMGFFAGAVDLDYKYNLKTGFWENARKLNRKVKPLYTNKKLFKEGITWCHLDPGILESFNFKRFGAYVPDTSSRHEKLTFFSARDDVIKNILKRNNMESLDNIIVGTAITNLTRMDFPRRYGELELDRLIMNPGGAFPLSNVFLVLGVVTCSGKLSLVIEYDGGKFSIDTINDIKHRALEYLFQKRRQSR